MKKILEKILAALAKRIVLKYKPKLIGITGSIGKTSAKEAVYAVLAAKFNVRKNIKNYNNELGVPLTIIGSEAGGRSIVSWLKVFSQALGLILVKDKEYPAILVLEMGADKPGDIDYLIDIAPCDIGVVTKVGPTHVEFFKSIENVAKEKQKIVTNLNKESFAILNYDDELVRAMAEKVKAKVLFFGRDERADISYTDLLSQGDGLDLQGIKFKINYAGSSVPCFLPGVIGAHQIYSALVATSVGIALGLNLIEICDGLKNYQAPKGRMHLIRGLNNSLIIDDTYNSSPDAAEAAVLAVAKIDCLRHVAILGDMLELGDLADTAHFNLGKQVAEAKFDLLVAVGKYREKLVAGARAAGLENVLLYENSEMARSEIEKNLQKGDIILVKGSQGSRMEKIVKELMAEPEKSGQLLVRQTKDWQ